MRITFSHHTSFARMMIIIYGYSQCKFALKKMVLHVVAIVSSNYYEAWPSDKDFTKRQ